MLGYMAADIMIRVSLCSTKYKLNRVLCHLCIILIKIPNDQLNDDTSHNQSHIL